MDKSTLGHYRLISAFLPENLEARFVDTQRHLFRTTAIPWALALPPFVPLRWCRDEADRLSKLLTHTEKPDAAFLPVRTAGWVPEPGAAGETSVAAALALEPAQGLRGVVEFFSHRTAPGAALFPGALGTLVLALDSAPHNGLASETAPGPACPAPVVSKVLRLGLLDLEVEGRGIRWEVYELGWLSRRDDR